MTTCSFTLTLTLSETLAFIDVVKAMLKLCDEKLAYGPRAPNWAHAHNCRSVLKDLKSGDLAENRNLVVGDSSYISLKTAVTTFNMRLFEKLIFCERTMTSTNSFHLPKDCAMTIRSLVKPVQDIMRQDPALDGNAKRICPSYSLPSLKVSGDEVVL